MTGQQYASAMGMGQQSAASSAAVAASLLAAAHTRVDWIALYGCAGPTGKVLLLPEDPNAVIICVATGTGEHAALCMLYRACCAVLCCAARQRGGHSSPDCCQAALLQLPPPHSPAPPPACRRHCALPHLGTFGSHSPHCGLALPSAHPAGIAPFRTFYRRMFMENVPNYKFTGKPSLPPFLSLSSLFHIHVKICLAGARLAAADAAL